MTEPNSLGYLPVPTWPVPSGLQAGADDFVITDAADETKQMEFDISSVPTGTQVTMSFTGSTQLIGRNTAVVGDLIVEDGVTHGTLSAGADSAFLQGSSVAPLGLAWTNPLTGRGDVYVYTGVAWGRLPVGADGQVVAALAADGNGVVWDDLQDVLTPAVKGNILVHDGTGLATRAIGADTFGLTANSAQPDGVEWAATSAATWTIASKGSLLGMNLAGDQIDVAVGTDTQVLVADSAEAVGFRWANRSSAVVFTFDTIVPDNFTTVLAAIQAGNRRILVRSNTTETVSGSLALTGDSIHVKIVAGATWDLDALRPNITSAVSTQVFTIEGPGTLASTPAAFNDTFFTNSSDGTRMLLSNLVIRVNTADSTMIQGNNRAILSNCIGIPGAPNAGALGAVYIRHNCTASDGGFDAGFLGDANDRNLIRNVTMSGNTLSYLTGSSFGNPVAMPFCDGLQVNCGVTTRFTAGRILKNLTALTNPPIMDIFFNDNAITHTAELDTLNIRNSQSDKMIFSNVTFASAVTWTGPFHDSNIFSGCTFNGAVNMSGIRCIYINCTFNAAATFSGNLMAITNCTFAVPPTLNGTNNTMNSCTSLAGAPVDGGVGNQILLIAT